MSKNQVKNKLTNKLTKEAVFLWPKLPATSLIILRVLEVLTNDGENTTQETDQTLCILTNLHPTPLRRGITKLKEEGLISMETSTSEIGLRVRTITLNTSAIYGTPETMKFAQAEIKRLLTQPKSQPTKPTPSPDTPSSPSQFSPEVQALMKKYPNLL